MKTKSTWTWLAIAAALFAFIYFFERHWGKPPPGPQPLLAGFQATNVTSLRILPLNAGAIDLTRTNADWLLTRPITFPAHKGRLAMLLGTIEQLLPAYTIPPAELARRPKADEEFGFNNPVVELELRRGERSDRLKFGRLTAPGDQVFVRVVGHEDIYVMDAALLALVPGSADAWRDTTLVDLRTMDYDRITVTNSGKFLGLQFDPTNQLWRLTDPMPVRADTLRLNAMLQELQTLSIARFVSDKANADLDSFGLAPASLSLGFAHGTNVLTTLHFGGTNELGQFYARRDGLTSIVTVSAEPLAPWRGTVSDFRDPQLVAVPVAATEIEVRTTEPFTLQRIGTNRWQLAGAKFRADAGIVGEFLSQLNALQIGQYLNAVTDAELSNYGLTSPVYQVTFKLPGAGGANTTALQLAFGRVEGDNIYVRRSDELSVYTVKRADFQRLPTAGWQLRERGLWHFPPDELARVVIRQNGRQRELIRTGTNAWTFAAGSQGILNSMAVEMAVRGFGELTATAWSARGEAAKDARFGITTNSLGLTFELKRGEKLDIQFGAQAPSQYPYARVTLDGEPWVFEFSTALFELVLNYLTIPASVP